MIIKSFTSVIFKQVVAVMFILISFPANALIIGNVSGTFANEYTNSPAPSGSDGDLFLSQIFGGSFEGNYTLSSEPEPGNWPVIDSWDISVYDSSMNLVAEISSSNPDNVGYWLDSYRTDDLIFYNTAGFAPYLYLTFEDGFVGNGDMTSRSVTGWFNGRMGGILGRLDIVSGSSRISNVSEPGTIVLLGLGLVGMMLKRRIA